MKFYRCRGKRIRDSDKSLFFRFLTSILSAIFIISLILFNGKQIVQINWKNISLVLENGLLFLSIFCNILTIVLSISICIVTTFLYYYFKRDRITQLIHRQKLARMILENKWYESESIKDDGFFKDLNSNKQKEKIVYFPKMYYELKEGLIYVKVEITLGKYQDKLLNLEKKLESGLYCELVSKELKDSYIEYVLLYDTIANRISIDEIKVRNGSLKLMKSVYWEFDKLPHMLIAGGTGGGKTYFILTIIEALLSTDSILYVLDPKNADLADLRTVMPNVYYKKDDMISCINNFYDEMMKRSETMKAMSNYKTGENYAYLGLPANFLIFDEYVAFMEMLGTKENTSVLNKLKQIVMLGRQSGFFLILACQRPDAKYLGDGIRDQFNFRVALGRMSELGYNMMFGESNKEFFLKQIKGRGYVDVGTNVISEFYTPLVPKGHDFLKEIDKIIKSRQVEQAACEAKADGSN
ncbi:FtsK/SpoIIIE domain-containing protein [Clostridioides difficile]|nr:FtsK/SpoIIIE domain-containing protein [Clostridioides difficile]